MPGRVTFHSATPDRWDDVVALFGPRGACAGCWCMWPRLRGGEFKRGCGDPNRRALRKLVAGGAEPGILAYADGVPVGWCALAPREDYPRITHSRLFGHDEPGPGTWSVVCFFVARAHRRQRLTTRLLEAATRYARAHGARVLEGYPVDPRAGTADTFAWTGLASAFRAAGFTEVARPSATRPLMRRVLRAGALRAQASRPHRAPAKAPAPSTRRTKPARG